MMEVAEQSTRTMTILLGVVAICLPYCRRDRDYEYNTRLCYREDTGDRYKDGSRAKTWDIRLQFIIEALTLSLIGGIAGIIIGIAGSKLLSVLTGWSTMISTFSIFLATGFSGLVGIFFGFYPAYKASLLNPVEALRYE